MSGSGYSVVVPLNYSQLNPIQPVIYQYNFSPEVIQLVLQED